ncbi:hypothetical protein Tco_0164164 [Tanacetum coccineum]
MSAITDIKCAFTQKALDAFCIKYHIPKEVHPVLPNKNDTMRERPAGKIGLYTRFFYYAKFRLPLSTFLVDVLRHFRVISTVGLFRCFYVNSKKNRWVSFSKRSDNAPGSCSSSGQLNAQDYATLVAHPSPLQKFPEAFLYLVRLSRYYPLDEETYPRFLHKNGEDMDIFAFIHTPDPTKVKIVKRERNEDEPLLLQTTVGRMVPLLLVAPDRAESELKASVDKLFDEGGSDVAPLQPRRQRKRKTLVVGAGEASHPPKKLKEDHGTPSRPSIAGKSRSAVQRLLARAVLNPDVGVAAMPTLPFITSSVSATPEHEGGDHTDSVTGLNLRTIRASQRFVISLDSSHHSGTNVAEAEVDYLIRSSVPVMTTVTTVTSTVDPAAVAKKKPAEPSLFGATSSLACGTDPTPGGFSDRTGSDFLVGDIRTLIDPDTDLQKTYFNVRDARQMSLSAEVRMRAEYNVKERRRLKSVVEMQDELLKVREGEIDNLKAQLLLREAEAARAIRLRAEASNFETVEMSLRGEVNALKERNTILEKERTALDVKVTDLEASMVGKEREMTGLNAWLTSVKSQNDNLVDRKVTVYEDCMGQLEKFQDDRMKEVNDKFDKLYVDFIKMALHLEERFYPYLLTTISGRQWLLTYGMELAITKCMHYPEYLSCPWSTYWSALRDIFVPLSEPFSAEAGADGNAEPFPNVDDAELNIP